MTSVHAHPARELADSQVELLAAAAEQGADALLRLFGGRSHGAE